MKSYFYETPMPVYTEQRFESLSVRRPTLSRSVPLYVPMSTTSLGCSIVFGR